MERWQAIVEFRPTLHDDRMIDAKFTFWARGADDAREMGNRLADITADGSTRVSSVSVTRVVL